MCFEYASNTALNANAPVYCSNCFRVEAGRTSYVGVFTTVQYALFQRFYHASSLDKTQKRWKWEGVAYAVSTAVRMY